MKTFGKEISKAIILSLLFWAPVGYADVTVTLSDDGSGGVIAAIQGSGTVPDGLLTWAYFDDIGDYTHAETSAVLSTPIQFAPGISIIELDIDHDNKPAWPDDPDDFGLNFDFETAPGTNFEIDGVSALTGLSFSDLIPGTYSVVSDSAGVGLGTLIINEFVINPGLNDAWYYPETDGQGFFITVFPDLETVSLAWFTYDTELPPIDATSNLGDPGHRWLTAVGPIDGNQVLMNIELTSGGLFDTSTDIIRTDPPGSDGTILLTFDSCSAGTIEYSIPSINRQGIVPIERVVDDNIALCEMLSTQ